jgi:hypothetical protein
MTWEELPNESPDFIDLGDTLLSVPVRASFSLKNHTTNKHFRCALDCLHAVLGPAMHTSICIRLPLT